MNRHLTKFCKVSALISLSILLFIISKCSDDSTAPQNFITIKILTPTSDSILTFSPVKITTSINASCSCQKVVEFFIDDSLRYTDYSGPFEYSWDITNVIGMHKIKTVAYLVGKASGADSLTVRVKQ